MTKNNKTTSKKVASQAAKTLQDSNSSKIAKELAASALSQADKAKQTGADMEAKASKVLISEKYSPETKALAASLLAQSNKKR
ncbi:MAG: hypothetical protein RL308_93 [Bacteroidota bacterium]|jgi:hypothetical protein